jgi:ribosomal protein S18 acetylase RimI-like enzyme
MQIRVANAADAAAIARVHVATWQVAYRGQMPDAFLDRLDVRPRTVRWQEILSQNNGITFVAQGETGVIGFSNLMPSRDPEADPKTIAEIAAVYVEPNHWRRGIGHALCQRTIQEAKQRGFARVTLWVLKTNLPAIKFYERLEFTSDGATKIERLKDFELNEIRFGLRL